MSRIHGVSLAREIRNLLRNPLDRFLVKLLWFKSKGLPEHLRVAEINEVMRVRETIRKRAMDEARVDFIILEVLSALDDAEGPIFYTPRKNNECYEGGYNNSPKLVPKLWNFWRLS